MAQPSERGTEEQTLVQEQHTEQTPLLGDHQSDQQADVDDEAEKGGRPTSWWIWRGFWVILGALFLALFIKGWIDAGGDVEVRLCSVSC